jgi:hypothetical protein
MQIKEKRRLGSESMSLVDFGCIAACGVQKKLPLVSQARDFVGCHRSALNKEEEENNGAHQASCHSHRRRGEIG